MVDFESAQATRDGITMWMERIQAESVEPLIMRCEWIALFLYFCWYVVNIVIIVINIVMCCVCVWISVRASIRQTRCRHKWKTPSAIQQNSTLFWLQSERRMLSAHWCCCIVDRSCSCTDDGDNDTVATRWWCALNNYRNWIGKVKLLVFFGNNTNVLMDDVTNKKINLLQIPRRNVTLTSLRKDVNIFSSSPICNRMSTQKITRERE